jgi:cytochrome d ubiquinol oxidase subunit I
VSFHIVFPALTIGLASYLAVLEAIWLGTGRQVYLDLYHFWLKIFAVAFGMGVVSGLVMAYQFGTNWSRFSTFAGGVTGPLLAYEVLTAFFLEAGFLGVMLFGLRRVGPGLHFLSTVMVALGTLISATWILASNSWMQTPQGYQIIDGRVVPVDWIAVIFNPSFPYRLAHMVVAAFLATALVVGATGAWHLLRGRRGEPVRVMFAMAIGMILLAAPVQAFIGDLHGLNTLKHQPAKLAAIEGHWENKPGEAVPLVLFGLPDMEAETTRAAIEIPGLGSLLLTHSAKGQFPGLKDFPREDRPNAAVVFWTFRVMVGLGLLMIALGMCGAWLRFRGRLYLSKTVLGLCTGDGARRHRLHPRGLVHHRDRPPAVGRVQGDAHRRCSLRSRRWSGRLHLGAVRRGLSARLRRRHDLPDPHTRQGPLGGRGCASDRRRARADASADAAAVRGDGALVRAGRSQRRVVLTWASTFPSSGPSSSSSP